MIKLLNKLYLIAGSQKGRIQKMLLFESLKGFFQGMTIGATMFFIMRLSQQIFEGNNIAQQDIIIVFLIAFISIVGKITFGYLSDRNKNIGAYTLGAENRMEIGDKLKNVNMGYFSTNKIGDVSAGMTRIIQELETLGIFIISKLFSGTIQTIILGVFVIPFDIVAGLIVIATVFIGIVVSRKYKDKMASVTSKLLGLKIKLNSSMIEYIKGIGVTKAFGNSNIILDDIENTIEENKRGFFKVEKDVAPIGMACLLLYRTGTVLIILTSIFRYVEGDITATKAILLCVAAFVMFDGLEIAGNMQNFIGISNKNIDSLLELKNIELIKEGSKLEISNAKVQFKNVDFSYDEKQIFKNLNLIIPANKTTAIVGASGSGKTTLCNLIARFWDVNSGEILIDDVNVKSYNYNNLLSQFTFVFQDVYLFDDTIKNNIKFGKPEASDEEIIEAAKKARCHEFISNLEKGYDTELQEGGSNISGGERQRISIARAMLKPSKLVILDEATSSVDPENEEKLIEAFNKLLEGKTSIIIAHKLETIKNADQIIVLNEGKIESIGRHKELMEESKTYRKFVDYRMEATGWKVN